MLEALPRRAVLGRLATLPLIGTIGAPLVTCASAAHAGTLAAIDAAEKACGDTKQAFEGALAAYAASFPRPHRTIDYADRANALCARWTYVNFRFQGPTRYLPGDSCLEEDYADFWKANREDHESCRSYGRMTRRLKARVKRYKKQIALHARQHRLEELEAARSQADYTMHKLAQAAFERPATTMAEVLLQAHTLRAFSATLGENNDWPTFQAGLFGRQLAGSLCSLEEAA